MKKYISGDYAFYDDEKELFYVYVGLDNETMDLFASIYGNTKSTAIENGQKAAAALNYIQIN